ELPDLRCVRLDLDPSEHMDELDALTEELLFPDREDEIAFRRGKRYVARLDRYVHSRHDGSFTLNDHSAYLLTGGLGALGLRVAQWMTTQGARHLVVTGRREPSQEVQTALNRLEESGVSVLFVKSDISKYHDVVQLFETVKAEMPPLRGVIHA